MSLQAIASPVGFIYYITFGVGVGVEELYNTDLLCSSGARFGMLLLRRTTNSIDCWRDNTHSCLFAFGSREGLTAHSTI